MPENNKWQELVDKESNQKRDSILKCPLLKEIEQRNISETTDPAEILKRNLIYLNEAVSVDIETPPVSEKGGFKGKLINLYRKIVWKLLGFQIHHIAVQQNLINDRMFRCLKQLNESIHSKEKDS